MLMAVESRVPGRFRAIVRDCTALQRRYHGCTDAELTARYQRLRALAGRRSPPRYLMAHTFAVGREAARRALGMAHRPMQLLGAAAVAHNRIAEIATGEGKTITLFLAAVFHALPGNGVHVMTANPYLATRDAAALAPAYRLLGLTVHALPETADREQRRLAYAADVTYGTVTEFGFDHLRDNLVTDPADRVRRGAPVAILDEADAVLVDEANTPLVLTTSTGSPTSPRVSALAAAVPQLAPVLDYRGNLAAGTVGYTDHGWQRLRHLCAATPDAWCSPSFLTSAQNALAAHLLYEAGRDYLVDQGQVVLLDVHTGRSLPGRRLSDGLHQALEAKENVPVHADPVPQASISVQRFLRQYRALGGVSGTVITEAAELHDTYRLPVVRIPAHRPLRREDLPDQLYLTAAKRDIALIDQAASAHSQGRSVLISAPSIAVVRSLSTRLTKVGICHQVLTAEHDDVEAAIVAGAGELGAVTVATALAGRGTDIRLGGPVGAMAQRIRGLGGLLVLSAGRSTSRRTDRQLAGRAGRQGDPGATRFLLSAEDDLLLDNAPSELRRLVDASPPHPGTPLVGWPVDRLVHRAQAVADWRRFAERRQTRRYDEVIGHQDKVVTRSRNEILTGDLREVLAALAFRGSEWSPDTLRLLDPRPWPAVTYSGPDGITVAVQDRIADALTRQRDEEIRVRLLAVVDQAWAEHLQVLLAHQDASHTAVWSRTDPAEEFRRLAIISYRELRLRTRRDLLRALLHDQPLAKLPKRAREAP
ncbi:preprotein translocase subunit SecA [Crossiella cryophila]|uniref:Protein translocase subunit SecA n=1 Tax=Crossiella cryophila TaxID=43355 RepID=A0A7W7C9W8_9PSEU|nr:hypothetical protein [Crossiella cryophila]MBB4677245.1 preprotein translocase subunit SecA [Crossiella cryophila]